MSSDWSIYTVEQIAAPTQSALATGPFGSSISAKYFVESGVPVIRGSNLSPDTSIRLIEDGLVFVSTAKAEEFQRSIARQGDLIFTCWGTINQVGFIDRRASFDRYIVSNKQMKLTVDSNKADPRFIYYAFSGPAKQTEILDNGIGSSVPGFNLGQLKKHEILLPCLAEQVAIANLLESLDDRITLLRETNATLEAMAQALFKSWFVDFDPVHANAGTRAATLPAELQALFPSTFTDTPQGPVPEGWELNKLGNICQFQKGCSYKGAGLTENEGAFMFNLGCFNAPRIYAFENIKRYISEYKPRHAVASGDLIVANTDMTQSRDILGRPLIIPDGYETAFASHHVFKVELLEANLRNLLFFSFGTSAFRERAVGYATGTTVLALPRDALEMHQLIVPPIKVRIVFDSYIEPMLNSIQENQRKAQTLATLRDTLLPRLISGQLRLPDAEAALAEVGA